ncbi:hypothetical protein [Myxococcus xanthus]|uniref:hypothetical protein n=1 Tax=Myxococcus xanthus TaxID=34 RepID=UPI001F189F4E|nr:hypothetical protein [Myxococcus xanthus]
MKKFNTLGVVGLLSLAAVGCGGKYTPEEEQAMQQPELGDVEQAAESAYVDAGQTRDFSAWLFGATPFTIENPSPIATPYTAYCGGNSISGTVPANGSHNNMNLNCSVRGCACATMARRLASRSSSSAPGNTSDLAAPPSGWRPRGTLCRGFPFSWCAGP